MTPKKRVSISDETQLHRSNSPAPDLGALSISSVRSATPPPSILKTSSSHGSDASSFPRTATGSSTQSSSSSHSHRSIVRSLLPHSHSKSDPHSRHSHHEKSHGPAYEKAAHISIPADPIALCELFLNVFLTHPGVNTIEELKRDLGPRLLHRGYMHRINCREYNVEEVWALPKFFKEKFDTCRVRVKSVLMDMDGTATMEQAAVALTYEMIGTKQMHKNAEPIEVHTSAVGVFKIFEGKLAQADVVADTLPFHLAKETSNKEVACSVM